eukprot:scaffold99374_cov67-Cyclotella_meneghiniana.AAC.6
MHEILESIGLKATVLLECRAHPLGQIYITPRVMAWKRRDVKGGTKERLLIRRIVLLHIIPVKNCSVVRMGSPVA